MTKERPILFSGTMVRAILEGGKTQTRRVCKPAEKESLTYVVGIQDPRDFGQRPLEVAGSGWFGDEDGDVEFYCPYGRPGDRLWVRETWAQPAALDPGPTVYRADYPACVPAGFENIPPAEAITWKPSIHMPRALCRLSLEITGVRVERLNDCSEADAAAEGLMPYAIYGGKVASWKASAEAQAARESATEAYRDLWDQINGTGAWDKNPWVWIVEFRRIYPELSRADNYPPHR